MWDKGYLNLNKNILVGFTFLLSDDNYSWHYIYETESLYEYVKVPLTSWDQTCKYKLKIKLL